MKWILLRWAGYVTLHCTMLLHDAMLRCITLRFVTLGSDYITLCHVTSHYNLLHYITLRYVMYGQVHFIALGVFIHSLFNFVMPARW